MSMRKVNATPKGTRMMWKPRVKAICSRAGSNCDGSAASATSKARVMPVTPAEQTAPVLDAATMNSSARHWGGPVGAWAQRDDRDRPAGPASRARTARSDGLELFRVEHRPAELGVVEPVIGAPRGEELVVRPGLDDPAGLHDQDQVGIPDRGEP